MFRATLFPALLAFAHAGVAPNWNENFYYPAYEQTMTVTSVVIANGSYFPSTGVLAAFLGPEVRGITTAPINNPIPGDYQNKPSWAITVHGHATDVNKTITYSFYDLALGTVWKVATDVLGTDSQPPTGNQHMTGNQFIVNAIVGDAAAPTVLRYTEHNLQNCDEVHKFWDNNCCTRDDMTLSGVTHGLAPTAAPTVVPSCYELQRAFQDQCSDCTGTVPAPVPARRDWTANLKTLETLLERGFLSEQEFRTRTKQILEAI